MPATDCTALTGCASRLNTTFCGLTNSQPFDLAATASRKSK